jgi:hypothetical protein
MPAEGWARPPLGHLVEGRRLQLARSIYVDDLDPQRQRTITKPLPVLGNGPQVGDSARFCAVLPALRIAVALAATNRARTTGMPSAVGNPT